MKVKCISNTSKSLCFTPGNDYTAEDLGGGQYLISDDTTKIIAPLDGHYVKFELSEKSK